MSTDQITINFGDEHDDALRDALRTVLIENQAIFLNGSWGMGGSQQLETLKVGLGEVLVTIESETYIGLTITGPTSTVEMLVEEARGKLNYSQHH
ncbi:hypothetical protein K4L06_01475 [Lysobacter sp. BMK333-48F3]|uniref:hypothetical protein n=1 Tax=Lysobacter sp. BMK333-48F3 TaxID=2867962 RepID=UPI001C8BA8C2|nr:hypothetical protein [Lysobacter sp. BMK333-48F3]MBX9399964.1 hypothetical protein [Lysobacter sp. BMK333-48F3]